MSDKIPRKGNLSSYTTGRIKKRLVSPAKPLQSTINDRSTGTPGTTNYVQRSPIENTGTPGTSKFVQRSRLENTGTPGTSTFVQRNFTSSPIKNGTLINKPRVLRKRPVGPTR